MSGAGGRASAYWAALRQKIIILTVLVALIPVPLVAGTFVRYYNTYIRGAVARELTAVALGRKEAIEVFLRERIMLLRTLAASHTRAGLSAPGELGRLLDLLRAQQAGLSDLGVIDASGRQVAYSGPYDLKGKDYGRAEWLREVAAKGVWVSDLSLGHRRVPHMVIAVRRDEGKKDFWVLRATIDAATFDRLVAGARLGEAGDAFVLNRALQYQVAPRFPARAAPSPALLKSPLATTTVTEIDARHDKVFQAATWLNNGRWLLVVREDSSAEFFSLGSAKRWAAGAFVFALVAVSATVILMTGRLMGRLQAREAELEGMCDRLAQTTRLAALGKLAAGVAHEINNPLAVIGESAGWMKELLEKGEGSGEQRRELIRAAEDIGAQVHRCRDITAQLLGFARQSESRLAPTDLNAVVRDAVELAHKGGGGQDVRVEEELSAGLPEVESDAAQLRQVFLNILDNAFYALGQRGGGTVVVATSREEGGVLVSIADDGPGIPREARERLFDPFFTTKPVGQGTGLGLSICYGIVTKLGGRLWAEHPPQGGAVFKVFLPAQGGGPEGNVAKQ